MAALGITYESSSSFIFIMILSLCSVFATFMISCLFCLKFTENKEDEEEGNKEHTPINNSKSPTVSAGASADGLAQRSNGMLWNKLNTWLTGAHGMSTSFTPVESSEARRGTQNNKPPAMGEVKINLVQPLPRQSSVTSGASTSVTPTNGFGHGKNPSSSYIPEGIKLPFELSFDNTEDPQHFLGKIEFSTIYIFPESRLCVRVLKATNLPAMDITGTSDPFVKCCLLPDRKRKLLTKIRHKTLNPTWNEVLYFEGLAYEKIQQKVLYLQVFDHDRFSRDDPIGEILLPLNTLNLAEEIHQCLPLTPCQRTNKRGELQLSLCYQPIEGILDVGIVQARNLKPMDINGTSDPYVKVWLIYRGKKVEKRKTPIIKNALNPSFDEEFTFTAPMERLRDSQLQITVMDYDVIGRNDTIGKIYLGHKSTGLEKMHWKEMLTNPRKPILQWHLLKV